MPLLASLRRMMSRRGPEEEDGAPPPALPDPALPPSRRGSWEEAALTNVDITEQVKGTIHTHTRPWEK